jgi:hypothetical protein
MSEKVVDVTRPHGQLSRTVEPWDTIKGGVDRGIDRDGTRGGPPSRPSRNGSSGPSAGLIGELSHNRLLLMGAFRGPLESGPSRTGNRIQWHLFASERR